MRVIPYLIGSVGALAAHSAALAADPYGTLSAPAAAPRIFEFRLGAFVHDPVSPEKGSADANGEFLVDVFRRDRGTFWGALTPRVHVGVTGNFAGKTSQVYGGFTWTFDLTQRVFIEAGLGGAAHNGKTALLPPVGFNAMGCGWAFHEQGTLGYRLTEAWSVMLTVEHTSNGGACRQNRGLTNVGMRVGYAF